MSGAVIVKLRGGEHTTLPDGLSIKLDSIVYEEVIAQPDNEAMYPGGSGILVNVSVSDGTDSATATFSEMSEPYSSARSFTWKHYRLELTGIAGGYNNAQAELKVHTRE